MYSEKGIATFRRKYSLVVEDSAFARCACMPITRVISMLELASTSDCCAFVNQTEKSSSILERSAFSSSFVLYTSRFYSVIVNVLMISKTFFTVLNATRKDKDFIILKSFNFDLRQPIHPTGSLTASISMELGSRINPSVEQTNPEKFVECVKRKMPFDRSSFTQAFQFIHFRGMRNNKRLENPLSFG